MSDWLTCDTLPNDAYGIGISSPMVFRTKKMSNNEIHLRLGYYSHNACAFFESGDGTHQPWKTYEVTHYCVLPEIPKPPLPLGNEDI